DKMLRIVGASTSGSVNQDLSMILPAGATYTVAAWVKSETPGVPVNGQIALAALGGHNKSTRVDFTAGDEWTFVHAPIEILRDDHTTLRVAFYVDTPDGVLLVDNATLVSGGSPDPGDENPDVEVVELENDSFETGSTAPWSRGQGNDVRFS